MLVETGSSWRSTGAARARVAALPGSQRADSRAQPFQPAWAPGPLLKSRERSKPPLGWPRTTDSLCPTCVNETRARILCGEQSIESLVNQHVGEIPAHIVERDGKVVIEKTCPTHGTFTDTLAINPAFLTPHRIALSRPRLRAGSRHAARPRHLLDQHGRGAVLTIDLTNRCNMMCDPCFMDANQVGYVHELTLDEVKQLLDDAISIKPRRQMTVQFSGGEPTISPIFLDAVRYAREVGYFSVQAATNGIRFAQDAGVRQAGTRGRPAHRLPAVRRRRRSRRTRTARSATCSMSSCARSRTCTPRASTCASWSPSSTPSTTIRSGRSSSSRCRTATRSVSCRFNRSRSPAATRISATRSATRKRYTLSHLAEDVKRQTGVTEPLRDWFPLSASSVFSDVTDLLQGPGADWGTLKCGCHPDCGIGMGFMVSKKTKEWAPVSQFINVDRLIRDARTSLPTRRAGRC